MKRSRPSATDASRFEAPSSMHLDGPIELRVKEIGQIFHTLDPLPFRERDLDAGVEEYIVGWAGEIAEGNEISIIVHLSTAEAQRAEALHLEEAIRNYFAYRSKVLGWDLRDLFRTGRASLAIGLTVLAFCIALGTSAGGIFVGRSVTAAPELFAAAIFNVGVMDTVRAEESANGITNISEFGSAKNAAEFPALLEMSTYQNIKNGTAYPAVMLVHGMNDPRVDVWHSGKTAARLQTATTSGKPIFLRLDMQAGHGVGSTATQRDALSADIYSFLLWQMGKTGVQ